MFELIALIVNEGKSAIDAKLCNRHFVNLIHKIYPWILFPSGVWNIFLDPQEANKCSIVLNEAEHKAACNAGRKAMWLSF